MSPPTASKSSRRRSPLEMWATSPVPSGLLCSFSFFTVGRVAGACEWGVPPELSGRLAVETMHRPQSCRPAGPGEGAAHQREGRTLPLAIRGDRQESGGLVDDDQLLVLVQPVEPARRARHRLTLLVPDDLDLVAGNQRVVAAPDRAAIDPHAPLPQPLPQRVAVPALQA